MLSQYLPAQQRTDTVKTSVGSYTVTLYCVAGETEWIDEQTYLKRALIAQMHARPHAQRKPKYQKETQR